MSWPSDTPPRDAGLSLFEVLIVLAILAATLALGAGALRRPSAESALNQAAAGVAADALSVRLRALTSGSPVLFMPKAPDRTRVFACDDRDARPSLLFFPDGSARGPALCLSNDGASVVRLETDRLTGLTRIVRDTR